MDKILVVDDNEDTIDMVKALLLREGYEVETATNGKEALSKLDANKTDSLPNLVVLDMFMPEMSGRQVCENIRGDTNLDAVKIVFFTAAGFSDQGRETLEKMNVSDYIVKPFHNDDFLARLKKILEN